MESLISIFKNISKYEEKWCQMMQIYNPYKDNFDIFLSDEIPYFDKTAYDKYKKHKKVYDKLWVAESQDIKCGKLDDLVENPEKISKLTFPIFIKPRWGHKSASSKGCYKIKGEGDLKKHLHKKNVMWSSFVDATEGMTDYILKEGEIVHQITYHYSEKQNGFSDVWKYISKDNKPPDYVTEWVNKNVKGFNGAVNVQYRGQSIIEVGLRLARGGSYITSTQNEPLIKNINNVMDLKEWDYNLEKEIDYSPFYAFKCHTSLPIVFLFPQYFLDSFILKHDCNSFYEYYFEPTGSSGMVFFQFFHEDFDKGMSAKKEMEMKFNILQQTAILLILGIIIGFFTSKIIGCTFLMFFIVLFLVRFLNPIGAQLSLLKAQKQYFGE
jgi:hypothetical protein